MKALSLFSGIGGFDLAAQWLDIEVIQMVEIDLFCQKILTKNFSAIPIHSDIKTYSPILSGVDLVYGGFPCQDTSLAGQQKGITNGQRSSLFFEMFRVYKESRATFLILENVFGLFRNGFRELLGTLSESGCDAEWQTIPASIFKAPHQRERVFIIAYPSSLQFSREPLSWADQIGDQIERVRSLGLWEKPQPPVRRMADGIPFKLDSTVKSDRLDRGRAIGNSVSPAQAIVPLLRIKYLHELCDDI